MFRASKGSKVWVKVHAIIAYPAFIFVEPPAAPFLSLPVALSPAHTRAAPLVHNINTIVAKPAVLWGVA